MPGTNLGTAFVQIVPSAKGIDGAINNVMNGAAGNAGDAAGKTIASKIKNAIVAAGIGTAITAGIRSSLLEGAELEQNIGGTKAVFGDFYTDIQSKAKEAYMKMGMSASDYMATANRMGSLFQGSGIEQQRSLKLTSEAMQRAADVASVMGIDTQWAMDSIANAAKGNFTMMDNLGVKMDATAISAYALEKGINFKWDTATEAEKAELAMKMFMDKTSQYEGNFAKESSDTFSGSLGAMKAAAQDFAGNLSLGENVKPALQNLITTTRTFLFDNLIPALGNIFMAMPSVIGTLIQTGIPQFMATGTQLVTTLANGAKTALPGMIKTLMTGLVNLSGQLRNGFSRFVDVGLNLVRSIADGIIKNIPTFIQTVPKIVTNIAGIINDNAPKMLETGLHIIKALALGLIKAIPVLVKNIPQIVKALWAVFMAIQWANLGKMAVTGIGKGLKAMAGHIKSAAKNICDKITAPVRAIPGKISGAISSIKSKLSFSGLSTKVKQVFDKVKEKITEPLTKAKEKVKEAVDKIKGMFPFNVGKIFSGKIKLPKISVKKTSDGGAKTSSSTSTTNFAKAMDTPYMFNRETVFAAGEAGDEILYGRNSLMQDITEAMNRSGGSGEIVVNLNYDATDDATDMLRDLVRGVRRYRMAGAF